MYYNFFRCDTLKKKIILIALIGAILSIIIYFYTRSNEINIVSLGDAVSLGLTPYNIKGYSFNDFLKEEYQEKHILNKYYEFSSSGKTVKELIYEIKENKVMNYNNEDIEIQRAINEANILTICIGMDELSEDKITKEIIEEYKHDMEELLSIISLLNKHKVIVIGLYTIHKEEYLNIHKINSIIRDIAIQNHFTYVDISNILSNNYYFNQKNYYLNYLGNEAIYNEIKKSL